MAKTKQTARKSSGGVSPRKLLATKAARGAGAVARAAVAAAHAAVATAKSNDNNKTQRNTTASTTRTGGKRKKKTSSSRRPNPVGDEEEELESWTCHSCDFAQRPTRRTMEEHAQCSRCSCVRGDVLHTERSAGVEHLLRNHPLQTRIPFRCVRGRENIYQKKKPTQMPQTAASNHTSSVTPPSSPLVHVYLPIS